MLSYELNNDLKHRSTEQLLEELNNLRKQVILHIFCIPAERDELIRLISCLRRAVQLTTSRQWYWRRPLAEGWGNEPRLMSEKSHMWDETTKCTKTIVTVVASYGDSHYRGVVPDHIYYA